MKKGAIAVDFDGVIHRYSKGWQDGTIYDDPMPGAIDALEKLLEKYHVFIFSARPPEQIIKWILPMLNERGIAVMEIEPHEVFWNGRGEESIIGVTTKKLAAQAYIDDRAVRFTTWQETIKKV